MKEQKTCGPKNQKVTLERAVRNTMKRLRKDKRKKGSFLSSREDDCNFDLSDDLQDESRSLHEIEKEIQQLSAQHEEMRTSLACPIITIEAAEAQKKLEGIEKRLNLLRIQRDRTIEKSGELRQIPPVFLTTQVKANLHQRATVPQFTSPSFLKEATQSPASESSRPLVLSDIAPSLNPAKISEKSAQSTSCDGLISGIIDVASPCGTSSSFSSISSSSISFPAPVPPVPPPRKRLKLNEACKSISKRHRGTTTESLGSRKRERKISTPANLSDLPSAKANKRTIQARRKDGEQSIFDLLAEQRGKKFKILSTTAPEASCTTSPILAERLDQSASPDKSQFARDRMKSCVSCGSAEMEIDTKHASIVCLACGVVQPNNFEVSVEVDAAKLERKGSGYKRPAHMADIVAQFQGKRRTPVPEEVLARVKKEIDKFGIIHQRVTVLTVGQVLKKLEGGNTYYKYCAEIASKISGIPPPFMNAMQEDAIFMLFPLVVAAYETSPRYLKKKENRVGRIKEFPNSMNYNYVFYKLCELLLFQQFLCYIKLPKNPDNIRDNDVNGWRHVCMLNKWRYIPTI